MSEQQPLEPRTRSLLDKEVTTSWFTAKLVYISHKDREQYVRILRAHLQDSVSERASLQSRTASHISKAESQIAHLRAQGAQKQVELERAEESLCEEKQRVMFKRLVHDAKHEGLEVLLSKVENTIWGL